MTKDLTLGSPFRQIISFAFPVYLGLLFQQFYNVVDTILVGQLLGVRQLAGVGSTTSLNFMVIGFCTGLCSGFSIPVAQEFGAGEYSGLRRFVANSPWLTGVMEMIARAIAGWYLAPNFGFPGLCFAHPLAWVFADCFLLPAFFLCYRKIRRQAA